MVYCPLPCYAANKKSDISSLMVAFFCQYLFSVSSYIGDLKTHKYTCNCDYSSLSLVEAFTDNLYFPWL